ncbi:MAG: Gfo/Idh/MocA family oxidoreductase [Candidatus Omnitrophica bacterium]|nr:Gfo/Idh/MocA family oxidoreductase [Candidatus Omnitrophota bacterium]
MVKLGIMSFAHMHAYGYAECMSRLDGAILAGIADDNTARGRKMARKFHVKFFSSYKALLDEDIDGVIITSENSRHREMVGMAASCKRHILCEKPLAASIKDAQAMIDICRENSVKLQTAFPCRFATPAIRARAIINEGRLGKVLAINGTNRGKMPGGWFIDKKKSGGGAVMDHTVHVVDLMRWFLKQEVTEVYAEVDTRFHNIKTDDCGILTMEFGDGTFATLDPSWSRPAKSFPAWGDVTMEIVGTEGVLSLDIFNQKFSLFSEKEGKENWVNWGDNMDNGLVEDFVHMIEEEREPSITGYDGLKATEVAVAAYQSAKRKGPVRLPLE